MRFLQNFFFIIAACFKNVLPVNHTSRDLITKPSSFLQRNKYAIGLSVCGMAFFGATYLFCKKTIEKKSPAFKGSAYIALIEKVHQKWLDMPGGVEKVTFKASDGVTLAGVWIKREKALGTLVVSHGLGGCKEKRSVFAEVFPEFNIFLFDFRAHHQSGGDYISFGYHEAKDVIAAAEWARKATNDQKTNSGKQLPLMIAGVSMGGAAALRAAENNDELCEALIIDSTFSDFVAIAESKFSRFAYPFVSVVKNMANFLSRSNLDDVKPIKSVKKITQPILFMHSKEDTLIPYSETLKLKAAHCHNLTDMWISLAGNHADLIHEQPQEYYEKVMAFFTKMTGELT